MEIKTYYNFCFNLKLFVANQHKTDPTQTKSAPCQNEKPNAVANTAEENAEEKTGIKYEAPVSMVTLPFIIPTFHAA